jgi:hypothetical protein
MNNVLVNNNVTRKGNGFVGFSPKGARVWVALAEATNHVGDIGTADEIEIEFESFDRKADIVFVRPTRVVARHAAKGGRPGTPGFGSKRELVLLDAPAPVAPLNVINLPGLRARFDHAIEKGAKRVHIKVPACESTGGDPVKVHLGKDGKLVITDGGPFGANRFWGKVDLDGSWTPTRNCPAHVIRFIEDLDADPAGVAKLSGQLTGSCCFCSRELETKESVGAGYGPVCAEKFGLPWGAETAVSFDEVVNS